jgi:branched-chain amino acid aminotransferase
MAIGSGSPLGTSTGSRSSTGNRSSTGSRSSTETPHTTSAPRATQQDSIVYFDGAFVPLHEATITVATHALHYGTGVFEGIRGYWSEEHEELYVLKLPEHVDRFFRSCSVVRIQPPFSRSEMCDALLEVLRRNGFRQDVYVRPLGFKATETIRLTLTSLKDSFTIFAFPFGLYVHRENGLNVCVSGWRRIDDNTIPARAKITGSYVNAALASDDAVRAGFDEALMLTQAGTLAEASSANLFLVRHGRLVTPPPSENILEGITREAVMQLARQELGIHTDERVVGRTEIYIADEAFLTGTGVQIEPIANVDGRPVGTGEPGPVVTQLQKLYADAVRNRLASYADWCTPVYGGAK